MRSIPLVQTSVFVDRRYPFGGNQLATFWNSKVNETISTDEMQSIALEMNFSETTFIEKTDLKDCSFKVRIFTPASEIPFAGHPTLGTSFVMKYKKLVSSSLKNTILELGVGPIAVEYMGTDFIQMEQPAPKFGEIIEDLSIITNALGLEPEDVVQEFPIQAVSTGFPFLIVPLRDLATVKRVQPNAHNIINDLRDFVTQEVLIFSTESVHLDSHVHARMFAPSAGILEDPATGSAIGPLGAYLEKYNILSDHELGEDIRVEQGYEIQRPSQLVVRIPNKEMNQVLVSGIIRLSAEGNFFLA